ncbi:MAG: hypothetical protein ACNA7U_05940 [Candidatus Izemoplasmataceae bacterium]
MKKKTVKNAHTKDHMIMAIILLVFYFTSGVVLFIPGLFILLFDLFVGTRTFKIFYMTGMIIAFVGFLISLWTYRKNVYNAYRQEKSLNLKRRELYLILLFSGLTFYSPFIFSPIFYFIHDGFLVHALRMPLLMFVVILNHLLLLPIGVSLIRLNGLNVGQYLTMKLKILFIFVIIFYLLNPAFHIWTMFNNVFFMPPPINVLFLIISARFYFHLKKQKQR